MNKINIKYVLDNGNVINKYYLDIHKLHCIDLNLIVLQDTPVDTDYIKEIQIRIRREEKQ